MRLTEEQIFQYQKIVLALEAAISAIQRDIDYQYSDESIDETLTINDYRFTKEGKVWN